VDLVGHVLQPVVGLGDASGGERVGGDDVGAGRKIRVVDGAYNVGPRQDQQVVVASNIARMVAEALATEVGLGQTVTLDECARRPVEYEDPLAQKGSEQEQALLTRPNRVVGDRCVFGRDRRYLSLGGPASLLSGSLPGADGERRNRMVRPAGRPLSGGAASLV
jgi:hypothetical protein